MIQQLEQPSTLSVSLVDLSINISSSKSKTEVNKLSQKYEIRHPHFLGKNEASCRVILPAKLVECVGIMKGDYLRIYEENNRLVIERMANQINDNGGHIESK